MLYKEVVFHIASVGVNFQKEFMYTSTYNLDIRESKRQHKDICGIFLYENPIWEKLRREEREFTICKGL